MYLVLLSHAALATVQLALCNEPVQGPVPSAKVRAAQKARPSRVLHAKLSAKVWEQHT